MWWNHGSFCYWHIKNSWVFFQKWVSVYLSHYSICGIYCWWRMQHIRGSFDRGKKAYFLQKPWWDFGTSAGIPLCCYKVCNAFLRSYTIKKMVFACVCAPLCVYIYIDMCGLVFMCIIAILFVWIIYTSWGRQVSVCGLC